MYVRLTHIINITYLLTYLLTKSMKGRPMSYGIGVNVNSSDVRTVDSSACGRKSAEFFFDSRTDGGSCSLTSNIIFQIIMINLEFSL